jgi:hypothetical protein
MPEVHLLSHGTKLLGKMLHTKEAHERYLMSRSLIRKLAGRKKMTQQPSLGGSGLMYHLWRKLREGRDKGRWRAIGDGHRFHFVGSKTTVWRLQNGFQLQNGGRSFSIKYSIMLGSWTVSKAWLL